MCNNAYLLYVLTIILHFYCVWISNYNVHRRKFYATKQCHSFTISLYFNATCASLLCLKNRFSTVITKLNNKNSSVRTHTLRWPLARIQINLFEQKKKFSLAYSNDHKLLLISLARWVILKFSWPIAVLYSISRKHIKCAIVLHTHINTRRRSEMPVSYSLMNTGKRSFGPKREPRAFVRIYVWV